MLTFMKAYGVWILAGLVVTAAFGWYRSEIEAAEQRGQALLMAEQSDSAFTAIIDSINGVWSERDLASKAESERLRDILSRQGVALTQARENASEAILASRGTIQALRDTLRTLTQTDLDVIAAGIDSLEEQARLCDSALGACKQLVRAGDARIWDLEARERQSLGLVRQQALVIDRLQNLRKPSIGTVGYFGWAVAGVEAIWLLLQAVGGN